MLLLGGILRLGEVRVGLVEQVDDCKVVMGIWLFGSVMDGYVQDLVSGWAWRMLVWIVY